MIILGLSVGLYETNCYVVGDKKGGEGIVIDPGDNAPGILKMVSSSGLKIKHIVITHGHSDHTGAVPAVKAATGAGVAIHSDDVRFTASFIKSPELLLKGEEVIQVGELKFNVIHTPGHSPGGICLYGDGVLFSGDTLFNYSIGRTDLGGGSMKLIIDSITTKLMVLPDDTRVYPGHGPATTIGNERKFNPFLLK